MFMLIIHTLYRMGDGSKICYLFLHIHMKLRPTLEELLIRDIVIGMETLIKAAGVQPDVATSRETQTNSKESIYKSMESGKVHCGRHNCTSSTSR